MPAATGRFPRWNRLLRRRVARVSMWRATGEVPGTRHAPVTVHPVAVEDVPRTPRRARLTAAAKRLKSAPTFSVPAHPRPSSPVLASHEMGDLSLDLGSGRPVVGRSTRDLLAVDVLGTSTASFNPTAMLRPLADLVHCDRSGHWITRLGELGQTVAFECRLIAQ